MLTAAAPRTKLAQTAAAAELMSVLAVYKGFVLTKTGSLMAAIEMSGWDPDGLIPEDHTALTYIGRVVYGMLPRSVCVSQYYTHYSGAQVNLLRRDNELSDLLSQRREVHLRSRNLNGSRLIHYLEIEPPENPNKLNPLQMLRHAGMAVFDKGSRELLKKMISDRSTLLMLTRQLDQQVLALQDAIKTVCGKWSGVMNARPMSLNETWAHMRFLANLRGPLLHDALNEIVPEQDLDVMMVDGDVSLVRVLNMEALKIAGPVTQYARIAAVKRIGKEAKPGQWARGDDAPIRAEGNYTLMMRWKPYSEVQRSIVFMKRNQEIERQSFDLFALLKGADQRSEMEKRALMKPKIQDKLNEMDTAERLNVIWGQTHAFVVAYDHDPHTLRDTVLRLDRSVQSAGFGLTWESVDLPYAYRAVQPGGREGCIRNMNTTLTQSMAIGLLYQSSVGQRVVPDLGNEEAQYLLESADRQVFHYSPFIGGRAMTIGIGPIRSGKTFFKNTLATHFMKYGGLLRAIDIDPGTETLAQLMGDDGGIFRIAAGDVAGLNPFSSFKEGDQSFIPHLTALLVEMIASNDEEHMGKLAPEEQEYLDNAIQKTLRLPVHLRNLTTLAAHTPPSLRRKFARWLTENDTGIPGRYAGFFDAAQDSAGSLSKRLSVFNLQGVRDDPKALRPILLELFFRVTRAFEDPSTRGMPKVLDIDEAHHALAIPAFSEYIVAKIRTWGKWYAGVQLWTQSPEELLKCPGWSAIRSAASTFIFMADPHMDENLYTETFQLSHGECEAIRGLKPRNEAYLVQRDIGVSKRVIIDVEPEQYVVNTSHPREAALRDRLVKKYGFQKGIALCLEELRKIQSHQGEARSARDERIELTNSEGETLIKRLSEKETSV